MVDLKCFSASNPSFFIYMKTKTVDAPTLYLDCITPSIYCPLLKIYLIKA